MKKSTKIWLSLIAIVVVGLAIIGYVSSKTETVTPVIPVLTAAVAELPVEPTVIIPTTGSVTVEFASQPTALAGNYTDNGTMLRAWAEKNKQSIIVPLGAKDIRIGFTFPKVSKYDAIPGNLQLSVDGKNLCNGRLTKDAAIVDLDTDTYRYSFNNVSTQDKPKGVDLSSAVGKTLGIKVWI